MTLDHLSLATVVSIFLQKDPQVANVTNSQVVGSRNPRAMFTVIGNNGAVLQVDIKRLMKGQEQEPAPNPTKPKAKPAPAKRKASKK